MDNYIITSGINSVELVRKSGNINQEKFAWSEDKGRWFRLR